MECVQAGVEICIKEQLLELGIDFKVWGKLGCLNARTVYATSSENSKNCNRNDKSWYRVNPCRAEFVLENIRIYLYFYLSSSVLWEFCTEHGNYPGYSSFSSTIGVNLLEAERNARHFADSILKWIFANKDYCRLIKFLLKFIRKGSLDDRSVLVKAMIWWRKGEMPTQWTEISTVLTW